MHHNAYIRRISNKLKNTRAQGQKIGRKIEFSKIEFYFKVRLKASRQRMGHVLPKKLKKIAEIRDIPCLSSEDGTKIHTHGYTE